MINVVNVVMTTECSMWLLGLGITVPIGQCECQQNPTPHPLLNLPPTPQNRNGLLFRLSCLREAVCLCTIMAPSLWNTIAAYMIWENCNILRQSIFLAYCLWYLKIYKTTTNQHLIYVAKPSTDPSFRNTDFHRLSWYALHHQKSTSFCISVFTSVS